MDIGGDDNGCVSCDNVAVSDFKNFDISGRRLRYRS